VTARRLGVLALTLVLLFTGAAASVGAVPDHLPGPRQRTTSFVGIDGLAYTVSSSVVIGRRSEKYYGPDFDLACDYGHAITRGMRSLARLAHIIERSGRTVVFTVAPNKSSVLTGRLDPAQLPHGECDAVGLREQQRVLDRFSDPNYLPLRRALRAVDWQTYWKTDLHWTSAGASIFSAALAAKLDPRLGRQQEYVLDTFTGLGGLNALLHDPTEETVLTARSANGVSVTPDEVAEDAIRDHRWRSSPARRTWPGRTLLVGDSMLAASWETMRPVFHKGRFMWLGHVETADIATAIARADTVILETIQLFVPVADLVTKQFRRQVRRALLEEQEAAP
jgi:hypothetical protein